MAIERLTAADQIMLWPDDRWPQEIGAMAILDGRGLFEADGRFRIEAVRADGAVQRLRAIAAETARRKARTRPDVGDLPHSGMAGRVSLLVIDRQRVNVCTADL